MKCLLREVVKIKTSKKRLKVAIWATDERLMSNRWATGERLMSNWWVTDERLMSDWRATDERLMNDWWASNWWASNWWATDEWLMSNWLMMIYWWLGGFDDGQMYAPTHTCTDGQRWLLSRYCDWKKGRKNNKPKMVYSRDLSKMEITDYHGHGL